MHIQFLAQLPKLSIFNTAPVLFETAGLNAPVTLNISIGLKLQQL